MLFLSETGMNFSDFVTAIRIRKAKEYLKFTELSTERIAELVGYCNRTHFSAVFTKITGSSPSAYRNKCRLTNKSDEAYMYVSLSKKDPMIIGQDLKGLKLFAEEYNVKSFIEAPETFNRSLVEKILEKVIAKKPAGLMITAYDEVFVPYINLAMRAGIPTITVDCDCPESGRIATVTSDWYEIGRLQAVYLAKAIDYRGKIAILYSEGPNNIRCGIKGFKSEISKYPEIEMIGMYDDAIDLYQAEKLAHEILGEFPDLAGAAGFDSHSAPGFCAALKKRGLAGKVKVTSVDVSPQLISLLEEGAVEMLVGQKRELFTYYGGKLLYSYNHSELTISPNIKGLCVSNIPSKIDTGVFVVKKEDVPTLRGHNQNNKAKQQPVI